MSIGPLSSATTIAPTYLSPRGIAAPAVQGGDASRGAVGPSDSGQLGPAFQISLSVSAVSLGNPGGASAPGPATPPPPGSGNADPIVAMQRKAAYAQQQIFQQALAASLLSGQI